MQLLLPSHSFHVYQTRLSWKNIFAEHSHGIERVAVMETVPASSAALSLGGQERHRAGAPGAPSVSEGAI